MDPHQFMPFIHERLVDTNGVLPWAENNQGSLSLLALIVALAIAVYEVKRAARSEMRAERAYCDWAINSAEHSMETSRDAIRTILTGDQSIYRMPLVQWRFQNGGAIAVLEEILPDKPNNPELTHHVNRLLRTMKMEVEGEDGSSEALKDLRAHLHYTEIARDHIRRLKPKTDRERIANFANEAVAKTSIGYTRLKAWRPFRKKLSYADEWGQPFDLTDRPTF
jgi:hypothetical protein